MANRMWVILCFPKLFMISPHLILWLTGSEWNCTSCPKLSIESHLITNRELVLHLSECIIVSKVLNHILQDVSPTAFLLAS